ncbi:MAG: DUF2007 domain-containing protein [Chloroflexi bacterium]|nr:DUF2007 domain-containing protein [Chloroflexota bacterium]
MPAKSRWVYLVTAPDQLTAEMWSELLRSEGLPVMVRSGDTASYLGVSFVPCRLLVREDRQEDARRVLAERLSPDSVDEGGSESP